MSRCYNRIMFLIDLTTHIHVSFSSRKLTKQKVSLLTAVRTLNHQAADLRDSIKTRIMARKMEIHLVTVLTISRGVMERTYPTISRLISHRKVTTAK